MGVRDRIEPFTRATGTEESKRFRRVLPGRLRRWLPSITLLALAVALIASTQSSGDVNRNVDVENMWASVAFLLFFAGATAWVWRKARGEGFEALRWRRLHRRIFWRAAALCLMGSMAALWWVAFWQWNADHAVNVADLPGWAADDGHARFFRGLAGWSAFAALPLVAAEPFAWRLWPKALRMAARRAQVAKRLSDRSRITPLELDPSCGAVGRPRAIDAVQAREPSRETHRVTPRGTRMAGWSRFAVDNWRHNAAIAWDGSALTLTDGRGRTFSFSVAAACDEVPGQDRDARRTVVELVWFTEQRFYRAGSTTRGDGVKSRILLLDAEGRRIAEMPAAGLSASRIADLARACGLPFAAYDLGTAREGERMANRLLFPRTRRTVRIREPRAPRGR